MIMFAILDHKLKNLILSLKFKGIFIRSLYEKNITSVFSKLSTRTGIKCTPHSLRHTHGTELSESGYHQEYIRVRMGHNSYESTNTYMHLSLESQTIAYQNFISARKKVI